MSEIALPSQASVVVIGGGAMGCSTLYHLALEGVTDAVLLERNALTSGTTWHSAAQVRALRSTQNLTNLIKYSISLYAKLEQETGQSTGWINEGSLSIATTPNRLTHIRRQASLAHLYGVRAEYISREQAKARWPLMNADGIIGAVWSPDDGRVGPSDLCAALIKGAKARGAKIFEQTAVKGILTKSGRIIAVETNRGMIRCDSIALCTGLWSKQAAALAGVQIPIWPCEHFYLLTQPIADITGNLPTLSDHDHHLYIRDDSGGLLVGCFEPMGKAINPEQLGDQFSFQLLPEDWDHFEPMMMNALHRLPILETASVKMLLNGPESFTPDGSFLLGESAETRGLYLGCGMNSVGVATAGGAGMALAHHIVHGLPPMDLHEVDPKRFPDCFNGVAALAARVPEVLGKHYEITFPGRQWHSSRNLRTAPLHDRWVAARAHFGQVYGYERPLYFCKTDDDPVLTFGQPVWFNQVGAEVIQAHTRAAIFDQSTFGKIRVTGPDAESFLNRVCTHHMSKPVGRAIYTTMLNERGGIESDLIALRIDTDDYRLYIGTAAIKRDMAWLKRHLRPREAVNLTDETENYAVIGLMGPHSATIATLLGADSLNALAYFQHGKADIAGVSVRGVRLSYVGEAGWEITCPADQACRLYDVLYEAGARPAGIFAQSAMRIEKRFLAYGHDLDTGITPLEAGLGFAISWDKEFIGKQALWAKKSQPLQRQLVSIIFDDETAVPIGQEPVYIDNTILGKTTSAAFGYRIGKPLALAMLQTYALNWDDIRRVEIDIAGHRTAGTICYKPAFDPQGSRMRTLSA